MVVFIRNNDILTITQRGVTTATDTKDGDGSTKVFNLDNKKVKNVRSVTVDSVTLTNYTDYTISYLTETDTTTITFTSAPSDDTDNIVISYDYGAGDKIYGDMPRIDIGLSSYPRIAVQYLSESTIPFDLGAKAFLTTGFYEIFVFGETPETVDDMINSIKTALIDSVKSFYYAKSVRFVSTTPLLPNPERGAGRKKIHQRSINVTAEFMIERAT